MIIPALGFDLGIKSQNVTAQMRENLYLDVKAERDKSSIIAYGTPGLTLFNGANAGASPYRGLTEQIGDFFYGVKSGTVYKINNAGVETAMSGTMTTTTGNVSMAYNGTQVIIVDGTAGYILTVATDSVASISDGDFPNGATTATFQGGFFLVDDPAHNGRFYKSASYDGTTWAATDFATAESSPDALIRVFTNQGIVHLLGDTTTEFWSNTGALDFPYAPIQGTAIEWGLAARWSVAKLQGQVAYLAKNLQGHVQVVQLNGFQPTPISSPELDDDLDDYQVSDAIAFVYMLQGHQFYQISFPNAGKTWLYDATMSAMAGSPIWSRLTSGAQGQTRHLANFYVNFTNRNLVSDYSNGNLYSLDYNSYTNNGATIRRLLRMKHVFKNNQQVVIGRLWVDMETGVGVAGNAEPITTYYANLPGASGDAVKATAVNVAGDITVEAYAAASDWTPASSQVITSVYNTTGNQRAWQLFVVVGTGGIAFTHSTDGLNFQTATSTTNVPASDGTGIWLKATRNATTGDVNFFTSTDSAYASVQTWTKLGATVSSSAGGQFASTASFVVGGSNQGTTFNFAGKVYSVKVYNSTTLVQSFSANDDPTAASTFTSALTGETYTLIGASSIANQVVAATTGANPQVMMRYSKDGGHTWSAELWRSIGAVGKYLTRVIWNRLGRARDWVIELAITDPVKVVIINAGVQIKEGRE